MVILTSGERCKCDFQAVGDQRLYWPSTLWPLFLAEDDRRGNRRLKRAIKVLEMENRDSFVVMMLTNVIDM